METAHKLIVHGLIKFNGKYLVIKRTPIKRGKPNAYPEYWDIPGGTVEAGKLPTKALIREVKEEVNLNVNVMRIIHEDSNLDTSKNIVFTRLVYICTVIDQNPSDIVLQLDEHNEYRIIESLEKMKDEKIVDYLVYLFNKGLLNR